ncbi:MAG: hypothetical protein M1821_000303 [Bathelium mastoideum]|nr:MAG: hypothetical protein M1821_000303 [Bathelium mastoideum]
MTSTIGIPIKLLNEATGHVVTLEITTGQVYRGKLLEAEDNMNVQLKDITVTARDGRVSHLDQVYIRGSHVRFFIVPDMLRYVLGTHLYPPQSAVHYVLDAAYSLCHLIQKRPHVPISRYKRTRKLTGSTPAKSQDSNAGLSHTWNLKTSYYEASLPIWIDEIRNVSEWRTDFMGEEAKQVVHVVGAWIYCFRKPVTQPDLDIIKSTLQAISDVRDHGTEYDWDGVCLAVAMPQFTTPHLGLPFEEWEDMCRDSGFEFIDAEAQGRNEFGEQVGIARVRDALEANDWTGEGSVDLDEFEGPLDSPTGDGRGFNMEGQEMSFEFAALKSALAGDASRSEAEGGEADSEQVDELDRMMVHLQAARETSSGLSGTQKKKFAAREVEKIMRQL